MQFKCAFGVISLCSALFLVGCNDDNSSVSQTPTVQEQKQKLQPIVIQGALPVESERMASKLENKTVEQIGGWTFWKGTYNGYPMIISKTRMGMSNSAAATALAIERYKPIAIINQGTAGGHDPDLHVYDIVLGKYATIKSVMTKVRWLKERLVQQMFGITNLIVFNFSTNVMALLLRKWKRLLLHKLRAS